MALKSEIEKLENAVREIKELGILYKNKNGNASLRVSNKDFNLWMVKELIAQRGRISALEARQKLILAAFGSSVPIWVFVFSCIL